LPRDPDASSSSSDSSDDESRRPQTARPLTTIKGGEIGGSNADDNDMSRFESIFKQVSWRLARARA
jgi:hypothetical protein